MKSIFQKIKSIFYKKECNSTLSKGTLNVKAIRIFCGAILVIVLAIYFTANSLSSRASTASDNVYETELNNPNLYSNAEVNESYEKTPITYVDKKERVDELRRGMNNFENKKRMKSYGSRDIPPGTLISAVLFNKVISNSNGHPVIAMVTEDYSQMGRVAIPKGTKLLGESSYEDESKRILVSFHTMVFPNRKSVSFSGIALDKEDSGSAGLGGKHRSSKGIRIAGSLLSNFVGGFAEGLHVSDAYGGSTNKANVKNAILKGTSITAIDQSKNFSSKLQDTKGVTTANKGYEFLVYIEKEISLR